jgi:hypothetical protein
MFNSKDIYIYINNYPKKMQKYTAYFYIQTALHVSNGNSTHHQELISLYLQYLALLRPYCYLSGKCLAGNCSSQPDTFKTGSSTVSIMPNTADTAIRALDDEWSYHLKHVEQFTNINKLYIVPSCWIIIDIYIYIYIQGVPRVKVTTSGECSLGQTIPI